ncbi:MAG: hypothetical protein HYT65_02970, partial [Candidatus Yanofskybacteria bacterium]|nr:hypothetical protein [Candidatus Yanofskybacteria bacterium]
MTEESREQINNFQPDKRTDGVSRDVFVRDGKVFYSAAVAANKSKLGYASDHVTRLARQRKILAVYEGGKWFVELDSLESHTKKAEENRKLGGLKAVGKLSAVLSSRLQEKTPGSDWGSSHGDDKPRNVHSYALRDKPVLSDKPHNAYLCTLRGKPVVDGYAVETDFQKPETKPGGYLFSGYTYQAPFWSWVQRAASRAIIVLAVLLFATTAGVVGIKNSDFIASHLPVGLVSSITQIEQSAETIPPQVAGIFSFLPDFKKMFLGPFIELANYGDNITRQILVLRDRINRIESTLFGYKLPPPVVLVPAPGQPRPIYVAAPIDQGFIRKLVKQFFNEEKSALVPLDLVSIQGSVNDLNQKLAELTSRVNQIPPPLQYIGGGGGLPSTPTLGGGDQPIVGSKLTIGNTVIGSGSVTTTSGDLTLSAAGNVIISDNLSVTGSTSFNGVSYGWPSADGSAGQFLSTNGSGILSWTTSSGVASNGIDFDEIVASASLDTNWDIALNGKSIDIGDGKFFINSSGASTSGNFEISGTASISGRLDLFANASISGTFEGAGTIKATTINSDGILTISPNVSASSNIEITGYASPSALFGAGLTDCDATLGDKALNWNVTTGKFSCTDDNSSTGGANIEVEETFDAFNDNTISSLSFEGNHFSLNASGSNDVIIRLDWTNGPASRAAAQTIAGSWTFSNASNQFSNTLEIKTASVSALTVGGSTISGTNTGNVTLAGTPNYLTLSGQEITLNKLDISDDTNATGGTGIDITTNDFTFDATELEALTWGAGGNASNVWTFNLSAGDPTLTWTQSGATLSLNFETLGYASSSKTFGSGLTDCDTATTSKLLWDATAGKFSCGTDTDTTGTAFVLDVGDGSTYHQVSSISFDASHFTTTFTASQSFVRL